MFLRRENGRTTMTTGDLERAEAGDREALVRMVLRYEPLLKRAINDRLGARLRRRLNPSDILQSTYLNALQGNFLGTTEEDFRRWLVHVLENTIRDRARFFDREKRRDDGLIGLDELQRTPTDHDADSPSLALTNSEETARVLRALSGLANDYRIVLVMRLFERRSYEETAAGLGRSEGATRVLYHRARTALAAALARQTH